jgi:hypothetical protein
MVKWQEYDEVKAKYRQMKAVLKGAKKMIQEQEERVAGLTTQILELTQQTKMQHSRLGLAGRTSRALEEKLLKMQDELNIARLELESKDRERLVLDEELRERRKKGRLSRLSLSHT